jgi:hypothetical protein
VGEKLVRKFEGGGGRVDIGANTDQNNNKR